MYNKFNYPVLSFFTLILVLPFIGIFSKLNFDINSLVNFLSNKYIHRVIFFSLYQAFISALISCIIAIPFSLALNRHKNNKIIKSIISLCGFSFVLPSILVVYAVIKIYGYNGILNNYFNFYNFFQIDTIYGLTGILLAHIFLNAPFATRLFVQNLNNIPEKYYEISKTLNLSFMGNIIKLEYPIIKQNLFTVFSIIFSLCFLSFAIVMALGGSPQNSTLEVAIYQYALFELNFQKAIILSFIQIFICLVFVLIGFFSIKGSNFFEIEIKTNIHPHKDIKLVKILDIIVIIFFAVLLFSPISVLILDFISTNFSKIIFNSYFLKSLTNSLVISIVTGIMVSGFGLLISSLIVINYNKFIFQQILFILSSMILIISPIIFSLGYFIVLQKLIHLVYFKFFVVILINSIFLLPFAILILFSNLKNVYLTFEDFKDTFRLNLISYFKILFPLIKKNFLYVFSFSTVITFGDFTIISFFRSENFDTLPSYLYKLMSVYRFNEASFVAGIIITMSLLIYFLIDNLIYQGKPVIKT